MKLKVLDVRDNAFKVHNLSSYPKNFLSETVVLASNSNLMNSKTFTDISKIMQTAKEKDKISSKYNPLLIV